MKEAPKQEFYEPGSSSMSIPFIPEESGHHFFLRANVIIVISVFVLTVVLLIGGFLALKGKQNQAKNNDQQVLEVSASPTPTPSCRPRPACLDAQPRCLIAETPDMCPAPSENPESSSVPEPSADNPNQTPTGIFCSMEARQCPDGSFVGRQAPNCDFAPCPTPGI